MGKYQITAAISACLCVTLVISYLWPPQTPAEISISANLATASSAQSSTPNNLHTNASQPGTSKFAASFEDEFPPDVKARLTALIPANDAWLHARGYANTYSTDGCCEGEDEPLGSMDGTPRDYLQYSDAQLQQLRAQGDMFAVHQLAARMMKSDEGKLQNFAKTKQLYREAAALGSLYALNALAYMDGLQDTTNRRNNPELARQFQLNKEAWDQVLTMRNYQIPGFLKELAHDPHAPVIDEADIKQRAEQLYRELAQQRREKNLPEFDNSPSELQQTVIAEIEKIRAQKKVQQAPSSPQQ